MYADTMRGRIVAVSFKKRHMRGAMVAGSTGHRHGGRQGADCAQQKHTPRTHRIILHGRRVFREVSSAPPSPLSKSTFQRGVMTRRLLRSLLSVLLVFGIAHIECVEGNHGFLVSFAAHMEETHSCAFDTGSSTGEDEFDSPAVPFSVVGGVLYGREYSKDTSRYVALDGQDTFYYDEVFDLLKSEMDGSPIYPLRLRGIGSKYEKARKNFVKNLKKSYRLVRDEEDGQYVLLHEVKKSRHKDQTGERTVALGWKVVPLKEEVLPIVVQVHTS